MNVAPRGLLVVVYSLLVRLLWPLGRLVAKFHRPLARQLEGRGDVRTLAAGIAAQRSQFAHSAIFFTSSAGEYEQAKPLIDRLVARGDWYVHIWFFSRSGFDYAQARGERLPYALTPPDTVWDWGRLMAASRPDITVVVRHELWPAFLSTARAYGRLDLVDASRSLGETHSWLSRCIRTRLLASFARIHAVSDADRRWFVDGYQLPPAKVLVSGDTKYDRVFERAARLDEQTRALGELLAQLAPTALRLVVGSAHPADLETVLAARRTLGAEGAAWQLIVAPHHLEESMLQRMETMCEAAGARLVRYSRLAAAPAAAIPSEAKAASPAIVLVDVMGILAELYGTAQAAFVGGALHHQVHNVLEPACRGLAVAFGPFYKNSQEACRLVELDVASVCPDAAALASWWRGLPPRLEQARAEMAEAVSGLRGAADHIIQDWSL